MPEELVSQITIFFLLIFTYRLSGLIAFDDSFFRFPELYVCCSSEDSQQVREKERGLLFAFMDWTEHAYWLVEHIRFSFILKT